MTTPLGGTVALVTGSSSGIGAATARRPAAEGAASTRWSTTPVNQLLVRAAAQTWWRPCYEATRTSG
ncbi:MAG TPA: hypothetical protein VMU20_03810 [Candidatus Dormibacteraeota bacterium]|nr:hypothetical protein [Candidatus Dormibacteraeota bacterium]